MTALEELKSSARDRLEVNQRELARIAEEERQVKDVRLNERCRDLLLDILSNVRTMYQVTIAEVRRTQDIDEIAELWKGTHAFYTGVLSSWQKLEETVLADGPSDELFLYCGRVIRDLERVSAEHYEFHA
jgi:hypothetical protein